MRGLPYMKDSYAEEFQFDANNIATGNIYIYNAHPRTRQSMPNSIFARCNISESHHQHMHFLSTYFVHTWNMVILATNLLTISFPIERCLSNLQNRQNEPLMTSPVPFSFGEYNKVNHSRTIRNVWSLMPQHWRKCSYEWLSFPAFLALYEIY